jgi:hypothetical protein
LAWKSHRNGGNSTQQFLPDQFDAILRPGRLMTVATAGTAGRKSNCFNRLFNDKGNTFAQRLSAPYCKCLIAVQKPEVPQDMSGRRRAIARDVQHVIFNE